MTKISIIFIGGYDKGYKFFIADENLFVCILIYFNKNIHFQLIIKNIGIINKIILKIQALLIYELSNKNQVKTLMTKISYISWRGYNKGVTTKALTIGLLPIYPIPV